MQFYQRLAQQLQTRAVVVATVTATRGSVPREVGAKMMVAADGSCFGTIGGGAGEAKVIRQALEVLTTGAKQFVDLDFSGLPHRDTQGICGGWMQIWLERWQGAAAIALTHEILNVLQLGQSGLLITPFHDRRSPQLRQDLPLSSLSPTVQPDAFWEPLLPPPTLLISGAGHVGIALAQAAHFAGFQIVIQDDRPEIWGSDRFPADTRVLTGAFAEALQNFAWPDQLYVALVTRGYAYDLAALRFLMKQPLPCRYIGMIGSEKRVQTVLKALTPEGLSSSPQPPIHAPIGLDIGALTPEEIAVSICAELIQVRRGGTATSLSSNPRQSLPTVSQAPSYEQSVRQP